MTKHSLKSGYVTLHHDKKEGGLYVLSRSVDQPINLQDSRKYGYQSTQIPTRYKYKNNNPKSDETKKQLKENHMTDEVDKLSNGAFCLYKHIYLLTDLHAFNTGIRTTRYGSKIKSNLAIIVHTLNLKKLNLLILVFSQMIISKVVEISQNKTS